MSVCLQHVPWWGVQGGHHERSQLCDKTTDAPLNAECRNRKRTLVRPSARFPQQSPLTLSFYKLTGAFAPCSKHESIPISHSGIWLEYIATPG